MLNLIQVIHLAFQIYTLLLFARILASWVPQLVEYRWMQLVCEVTDPYLNFFRRWIPPLGMIDFSPIIAFLALNFFENILIQFLIIALR